MVKYHPMGSPKHRARSVVVPMHTAVTNVPVGCGGAMLTLAGKMYTGAQPVEKHKHIVF